MRTISRDRKPSVPSGSYTWNADSTLASYPGPGYTRKLSYDEEGRLTKISRDNGTTITPVFEYGYGFDGNRRWRKDLAGNTWDWYPCGVACCAGELVTMRSTNGGVSWSQLESNMSVDGNTFRNGSLNLPDLVGNTSVRVAPTGTTELGYLDRNRTYRATPSAAMRLSTEGFGGNDEAFTDEVFALALAPDEERGWSCKTRPCNKKELGACKEICKKEGGSLTCFKGTLNNPRGQISILQCICKNDIKKLGCVIGCGLACGRLTHPLAIKACQTACVAACEKLMIKSPKQRSAMAQVEVCNLEVADTL